MLLLFCYLLLSTCCLPLQLAAQPVGSPSSLSEPPTPSPTNSIAAAPTAAPSISPTAPPVGTSPNATEQAALLALKAEWQDPAGHLANWTASNANSVCSSWRGVTCTNSSITSLFLSGLSLSGSLSGPAIANLSSLSVLNLSFNNLSGLIPPQLGSLLSLTSLFLNHNLFNGSIPTSLFSSSSLQFLLLQDNHLSGELPPSIANLKTLRYLSLQSNSLSGPFLSSLTNLTKLSAIFAASNQFNGTIPSEIGSLRRLVYLDLGDNLLTGSIPSSIGSLTLLKELVLRENQLGGPLPAELGNLHDAISFNLSHNFFNGTIPPQMGNLSSLQVLDLCENDLEGTIPASLGNLSMLKSLNLSFNNLSGQVPTNGVLANFNYTSYVGNELLCGDFLQYMQGCNLGGGPANTMPDRMKHRMPYGDGHTSSLGKNGKVTVAVLGGVFGLVVVFVLLVCVCCSCSRARRPEEAMERSTERGRNSFSMDLADSMRKAKLEIYNMESITQNYEEIVSHAGYFDTAHVIGKGRFATVYKSELPSGKHLAVKVFNNPITQAVFEREMATLHESAGPVSTLLPIRGYYSNPIEKAIFYDFMPKGTLYHVLKHTPTLLDWPKRLNIALGVANALSHLHSGSPSTLLHKDLKSSNVLLDDDLNPLVADYGIIDLVSKTVIETPGYTPPEFTNLSYSVRRYTTKTDVYSFGVVLLELLTGKSPISSDGEMSLILHDEDLSYQREKMSNASQQEGISSQEEENSHVSYEEEEMGTKVHLVTWVLGLLSQGQGLEVLHPIVVESCPSMEHRLQAFNLAILCIDDEPAQRPSMLEIISILERLTSNASPMGNNEHQSKRPLLK